MAHKKGQGATRNGRDSRPQFRGIKTFGGQEVKAVVVLKKGMTATEEEISEHCRKELASFKRPRYVEFIDELPRTSTGKILKRVLREQHGQS